MVFMIIISLTSLLLLFALFYVRTKQLLYKYHRLNKKIEDKFVDYISRIENRISKPFDEFNPSERKEDWLLIISYNRKDLLMGAISSARQHEPSIKIAVVDNGSCEEVTKALHKSFDEGAIDKLVLNKHDDVPQWQKCLSIAQAMKLLSLQSVKSLTIMDDDILVEAPWLQISGKLTSEMENVKFVSLMDDEIQDRIHKTLEKHTIDGELVKLKTSFIGTFFYIPVDSLIELGLPPFNEGIAEASVEDWYYSRLTKAKGWKIATINRCKHLGYAASIREAIEKRNKANNNS